MVNVLAIKNTISEPGLKLLLPWREGWCKGEKLHMRGVPEPPKSPYLFN